jgi:arginase
VVLLHTLDHSIVAADIVEYNPRCDISSMAGMVAAKLLKEVAEMMVRTTRESS